MVTARETTVAPMKAALGLGTVGLAAAHLTSRGRTRRVQQEIERQDPTTLVGAQRILWLGVSREFGWDTEQALSLALFRTYAVPEISVVLAATGEFERDGQRRYDDTELVFAHMAKHGFDHGTGRTALKRMNAMHASYDLPNDLMVYVLSTFVLEPSRWIDRWGWRGATERERQAAVTWFGEQGRRMGLRDLPTTWEDWDRLNRRFEDERFRFHPDNQRVGDATIQILLDRKVPRPVHAAARKVMLALLDEPRLLEAFGYDRPDPRLTRAVDVGLRARARVQRDLLPERRTDFDLTTIRRPSYPHGHVVESLGTFPDRATKDAVAAAQQELTARA